MYSPGNHLQFQAYHPLHYPTFMLQILFPQCNLLKLFPAPPPTNVSGNSHTPVANPSPNPDITASVQGCNFWVNILFRDKVKTPKTISGGHTCYYFRLRNRWFSDCIFHDKHEGPSFKNLETLRNFLKDNVVTPDVGHPKKLKWRMAIIWWMQALYGPIFFGPE